VCADFHEIGEEPEVQPGIFDFMIVDVFQIPVICIVPNLFVLAYAFTPYT